MASKIADVIFTYQFIKRLVTPFNETKAYQLGIIDERGKKIRSPQTKEELDSFSTFERLIFNIKKIIERFPGGKSKLASYAAALFLIKEHNNLKDEYSEKELTEELEKNMEELQEIENSKPKTFKKLMSEKEFGNMLFAKETAIRDVSEAMKYTHAVVDSDAKVIGFATNAKDAMFMSKNNITKKKGTVVQLAKPMSQKQGDMKIGRKLIESSNPKKLAFDKYMKQHKLDKSTVTMAVATPNDSQIKMIMKKEPKYNKAVELYKKINEDAPANATGPNVAGTGDDSSTVVVKPDARKKEIKKYLADYLKRRKKREEAKNKANMRKLMGLT
tara:strand:- start:2003 stop:2992 length:990 start_codon:yes stop_codon:yes gene_type:complete